MIITATGWTYAVVDEMDLDQVGELLDYWDAFPPVHISAARLAGAFLQPKEERGEEEARTPTEEDLRSVVAMFNGRQ